MLSKEEIEKKREEIQKLQQQVFIGNVLNDISSVKTFSVLIGVTDKVAVNTKDSCVFLDSPEFKKDLIELVKLHLEKTLSQ